MKLLLGVLVTLLVSGCITNPTSLHQDDKDDVWVAKTTYYLWGIFGSNTIYYFCRSNSDKHNLQPLCFEAFTLSNTPINTSVAGKSPEKHQ
jgi:hypothetical protein